MTLFRKCDWYRSWAWRAHAFDSNAWGQRQAERKLFPFNCLPVSLHLLGHLPSSVLLLASPPASPRGREAPSCALRASFTCFHYCAVSRHSWLVGSFVLSAYVNGLFCIGNLAKC